MVFPVNLEIVIALQIIGEKAHSAFKSHNLGADGHQEDLLFRELSGASLEKAFDIHFIEVHITEDFVQIRLVFIGGACAETDGVAEIIHRKSRHDGIQIDDTDSFAGLVVDHDIVQLCVVVGDTQRDFFFGKQFVKDAGKFLVGKDEFNLSLYRGGTAADILLYSFFEDLEPCLCVVKSGNRLVKGLCRIVGKKTLEVSECQRAFIEIFWTLHAVKAGCVCDKAVGSPVFAGGVHIVRLLIQGRDDVQRLAFRIAAPFHDLFPKVRGYAQDVFHDLHRFREDRAVHFLKNNFYDPHLTDFIDQEIGVVDMAVSIRFSFHQGAFKLKITDGFLELRVLFRFHREKLLSGNCSAG